MNKKIINQWFRLHPHYLWKFGSVGLRDFAMLLLGDLLGDFFNILTFEIYYTLDFLFFTFFILRSVGIDYCLSS